MKRRHFQAAGLGAFAGFALQAAGPARAQALGTVRILIPANPGGGWDQTGRALGVAMQAARVAQSVQYDNKGGAAGTIGLAQFVHAAKGDPHALMVAGMVMVGGIALNRSPVDLSMVTPVARLTTEHEVVVVPAASPHRTLGDLLKAFRADPGKVAWAGGSAGGTDHILVGMVAKATGVDPSRINYVAFKGGGEAVTAIVGGHVAAGVSGVGEFAEQVRAGRMRALAVSSPKGIDGVASLKEQGVDVELGNWRGVFGAPGLAPAQRDALVAAVRGATESPAWKESLQKFGWESAFLGGEDYRRFVVAEVARLGAIVESLGLRK
jgi:putative tricarboxylic transport membrane protein